MRAGPSSVVVVHHLTTEQRREEAWHVQKEKTDLRRALRNIN
jgi:ribosome recycling factor